jgi:hypothetical protein
VAAGTFIAPPAARAGALIVPVGRASVAESSASQCETGPAPNDQRFRAPDGKVRALIKRVIAIAVVPACFMAVSVFGMSAAGAAPLPDNCTKDQGTVTCTTFEGPGKNRGGVGETTVVETQGNTTNKSPEEQQDLEDSESCNPPSSQGRPCNP